MAREMRCTGCTYWAPSEYSVMLASVTVTVILAGGRGMDIIFSTGFFLTGRLGCLGMKVIVLSCVVFWTLTA
jgi:hypothetical protein